MSSGRGGSGAGFSGCHRSSSSSRRYRAVLNRPAVTFAWAAWRLCLLLLVVSLFLLWLRLLLLPLLTLLLLLLQSWLPTLGVGGNAVRCGGLLAVGAIITIQVVKLFASSELIAATGASRRRAGVGTSASHGAGRRHAVGGSGGGGGGGGCASSLCGQYRGKLRQQLGQNARRERGRGLAHATARRLRAGRHRVWHGEELLQGCALTGFARSKMRWRERHRRTDGQRHRQT